MWPPVASSRDYIVREMSAGIPTMASHCGKPSGRPQWEAKSSRVKRQRIKESKVKSQESKSQRLKSQESNKEPRVKESNNQKKTHNVWGHSTGNFPIREPSPPDISETCCPNGGAIWDSYVQGKNDLDQSRTLERY